MHGVRSGLETNNAAYWRRVQGLGSSAMNCCLELIEWGKSNDQGHEKLERPDLNCNCDSSYLLAEIPPWHAFVW